MSKVYILSALNIIRLVCKEISMQAQEIIRIKRTTEASGDETTMMITDSSMTVGHIFIYICMYIP